MNGTGTAMRARMATMALLCIPCLALATTGATASPTASAATCPLTDAQFSDQVDALEDWRSIHAHQSRYFPPCLDEGLMAQAHTELIVRTLVTNWHQLPALSVLVLEHPDFKAFVFRHVNASAATGDLQTVLTYATIRCPRGLVTLCSELRGAAAAALQLRQ